ncbi:NlpC/P60 family protein [Weissella minor]|uniref:NlpC/P60 domain-containing protein n=1 Tax=Weissella minor TaxID=1620 RepID=A0A0R2JG36_9LACO|nr:NlpC/P60 family protein [Weissella minor]KRN76312.1 hypothetical protein IV67_GL000888 [Weissella minor]
MGNKTNKLVVSGMVGAFGVIGVTQVPAVQAAMTHYEQAEKATSQQAIDADPVHQAVHENLKSLTGQTVAKQAQPSTPKPDKVKKAPISDQTKTRRAVENKTEQTNQTQAKAASAAQSASLQEQERLEKINASQSMAESIAVSEQQTAESAAQAESEAAMQAALEEQSAQAEQQAQAEAEAEAAAAQQAQAEDDAAQAAPAESEAVEIIPASTTTSTADSASEVASTSVADLDTWQSIADEQDEQSKSEDVQLNEQNDMTQAANKVVQAGTAETSGQLVAQSYEHATGQSLPTNTTEQESYLETTDLDGSDVQDVANAGDVVFWGDHGTSYQSGIYIGENQVVTVPDNDGTAQVQTIDQNPAFVGTFV